jgi:3-hydroxybutyryl-CoA dehydrogenase
MKVFIAGAGTMGIGIAQVFARYNNEVFIWDINEAFLNSNMENFKNTLKKLVDKEKISDDIAKNILSNIFIVKNYSTAGNCDLIVEAISEDIELKKELFKNLDEICSPNIIIASNTSSLSITEIASSMGRPQRAVGIHFFNPVPLMKLVEIIRGVKTSDEVINRVKDIVSSIEKEPIEAKESPGFIVNRILISMINEAVFLLSENIASAEDIDKAMVFGANHPMGPLALGDLIGNDVCLSVLEIIFRETGDPKYRPCPLLRKMVRAGYLGRKTKKGFYDY